MNFKLGYARAMERLYLACIVVSATALVLITLVIPYGVFMRYVMNSAASWPEPFSVLAMVLFSFVDSYEKAALHLSRFPLSGSHGLEQTLGIPELRKWPLRRFPHLIIYFDFEHAVEILRVVHGSVDVPAWLRDKE